tara:strand:+ start:421 stop:561 length:141 start_codon:yes stop_codon:yes gene_type:complete
MKDAFITTRVTKLEKKLFTKTAKRLKLTGSQLMRELIITLNTESNE